MFQHGEVGQDLSWRVLSRGQFKTILTRRVKGTVGQDLYEINDTRRWAAWGIDYAKYDWPVDSVDLTTRRMADAVAACGRYIVMELSNSVPLEKTP